MIKAGCFCRLFWVTNIVKTEAVSKSTKLVYENWIFEKILRYLSEYEIPFETASLLSASKNVIFVI